jgi:hypothetical protein
MNKKKKVPNFAKQKRAFDQVLEAYRNSRAHNGLGSVNLTVSKGTTCLDPAKPNMPEFRADVECVVEALVAVKYHLWFWAAYSWFDSTDAIERELFAQRLLGDRRHSWEQRLGARFIETGIYPPTAYFQHNRLMRAR